jgi:transposase
MIQLFYHASMRRPGMRGRFQDQGRLFSYISPEARVLANHLRELVGEVLSHGLGKLYAREGRPLVPSQKLVSALLQVFYGIRSERQLMEELNYNLLYRWFVGLPPPSGTPSIARSLRCRRSRSEKGPARSLARAACRVF